MLWTIHNGNAPGSKFRDEQGEVEDRNLECSLSSRWLKSKDIIYMSSETMKRCMLRFAKKSVNTGFHTVVAFFKYGRRINALDPDRTAGYAEVNR